MQAINARRARSDDLESIQDLIGDNMLQIVNKFGQVSIAYLIETSQLAISVVNEDGKVIGFAAFLDAPPKGLQFGSLVQDKWHEWFREVSRAVHICVYNIIFIYINYIYTYVHVYRQIYGQADGRQA